MRTKRFIIFSTLMGPILTSGFALGQSSITECADIENAEARLNCYDRVSENVRDLPVIRVPRNTNTVPQSDVDAPVASSAVQDEFGLDEKGTITLADEVHTPDSSRYWLASSYEQHLAEGKEPASLDKEFLRLWIAGKCDPYKDPIPEIPDETILEFSGKYIALYEKVTGLKFEHPDSEQSVGERVRANVAAALPEYFP